VIDFGDGDEAIGVRIRERPQQHAVHDAENRRRRADAKRERQNRQQRERRLAS